MSAPGRLTRRRAMGLGAGSIAGLGLLPACSSESSGSGGTVTIRFSYLWTGAEAKAMEKVITAFNQSQDKIVVEGVSNPDQQAQLAAMTGSKGAFDISDHFGTSTGSWGSKGIIQPLDDYIERDGFDLEDFVAPALDQCRYDDQIFQLPISVNNYALFYNKQLFSRAGVDGPPKTTSEWATAIEQLTKSGSNGLTQLGMAGSSGAGANYRLLGTVHGGRWYADDGTPTPDDAGNVAGADFYVDNVISKYGVDKIDRFASGFGDYQSPQNPFYQGKLAMVVDGEWQPSFIDEYAPDLEWGVAPIPHPDDRPELANSTLVEPGTLFIPSNSQHPDEAWEFMKYLVSAEAMLPFTLALSNLPSRTSLLDHADYDKITNFDLFLDLLSSENAHSLPAQPSYAEYTADLETADDEITRLVKSPQEAYAQVASKVDGYA